MSEATLTELRALVPGCELLALVDLTSCTLLASDCAIWRPQDHYDELCKFASDIMERIVDLPPSPVFEANFRGFRGIVPLSRSDVLCAELAPTTHLPDFIASVDQKRLALIPAGSDGHR